MPTSGGAPEFLILSVFCVLLEGICLLNLETGFFVVVVGGGGGFVFETGSYSVALASLELTM